MISSKQGDLAGARAMQKVSFFSETLLFRVVSHHHSYDESRGLSHSLHPRACSLGPSFSSLGRPPTRNARAQLRAHRRNAPGEG